MLLSMVRASNTKMFEILSESYNDEFHTYLRIHSNLVRYVRTSILSELCSVFSVTISGLDSSP